MSEVALPVKVGDRLSLARTVTEQDIIDFARVTGDDQALHLNPDFGTRTRFGKRIAHGMLSAGYISAALGTRLAPGWVVVYLSQDLRFRLPVGIGDTITANIEVTGTDPAQRIVTLQTDCVNQDGATVVQGEARVLLDPLEE